MMGMAKQLFAETEGYSPWQKNNRSRWPLLEKGWKTGCFAYVDYAFAEMLLRDFPDVSERAAAFLCHLSRACREGHICVQVDGDDITPPWFSEEGQEDFAELASQLALGAAELPEALFSDSATTPLYRRENLYYFQKFWLLESVFVKHFQRLLDSSPSLTIPHESIQAEQLNPQQQAAVQNALKHSFSVICGGPGTGKTFTAGHLIKRFWEALDEDQRQRCEICLAAPTGKAASNLQKSLQAQGFTTLKAQTLHALLGVRGAASGHSPKPLTADLILIDESSMIDVRLMAMLFAAVKSGARLVMLGDRYQLPPVEAGSLFADMIVSLQTRGCVTELTTCLRAERQTLINFASAINAGDSERMFQLLDDPGIEWIEGGEGDRNVQRRLVDLAADQFPSPKVGGKEPEDLLAAYNSFRMLTPLRRGLFGVDELNHQITTRMTRGVRMGEWFAVPIMVVTNDYKMELFNGEGGLLIRQRRADGLLSEGDYALFPMAQGESFRRVPAVLLPKYEYAYCLSVHKSQGSEFDHVLMLLPKGSEVFGREVLYTAVTRAKKKLAVWSTKEILTQTLAKTSARVSGLR